MYVEDEIAAAANPQPCTLKDLYTSEPVPESISQEQHQALREQAQKIKQLSKDLDQNFYDYKQFYVVSVKWFKRWEVYVSYNESNNDLPSSKFIGCGKLPVLNEDIVDMDFKVDVIFQEPNHYLNLALIDGLKADVDYQLVNKPIWEIFEKYQNIQVVRKMRETEDGRKVQVYLRKISAILLSNQVLKDIERQVLKTFKKFNVQLPQYQQIDNLIPQISERGREFLNSKMNWFKKLEFSQDPFKIWIVEDDMNESRLKENLRKGCKANASFFYKINFPGQPVVFNGTPLSKHEFSPRTLVVFEFKEKREDWVFFNKQNFLYAKCDCCKVTHVLNVFCSCMYRCYCSKDCKSRDKYTHKSRCDRDAESSQEEMEQQITEFSKKGRMGLRNLGNTCFMNSGIQCISSIEQLIEYFFHGTFVADINTNNPIGTKGQLSRAYGKLIRKMLCGTDASVSPSVLKRAIGKFQPMFIGYEQHDSGELISYLLDGLHQDLNRIKIKPYVETQHHGGRPDPVLAKEGWQNFTMRNQSKIVQLLFGQYKSKLYCPVCHQQSITFDPFMMLPLPIPQSNIKPMQVFVIRDHIHSTKLTINITKSSSYTMQTLMDDVAQKLNISNKMIASAGSHYSVEYIESDKVANDVRKQFKHKHITLRPLEPQQNAETGEKVNIIKSLCHSQYGPQTNRRNIANQSIYLFDKSKTLKDIHLTLFYYYHSLFTDVSDYQQDVINVPAADQKWRILIVTNGRHDVCFFCDQTGCENCPLPFDDKITLGDLVGKIKPSRFTYKLEFEIYWRKNSQAVEKEFQKIEKIDSGSCLLSEDVISIYDCFKLAQEPETLDQDNEWYCPVCKDFVLAQKQLTLYKAPKIFIMYFKRFKGRGFRGLIQSKLTTLIDFPVENLDINDFILDKNLPTEYDKKDGNMQVQQQVKYDLFAISNHYGSLGGGHYTAFCKKGGEWDQYDDSSVSPVSASKIVTPAAYVLFYRRRD